MESMTKMMYFFVVHAVAANDLSPLSAMAWKAQQWPNSSAKCMSNWHLNVWIRRNICTNQRVFKLRRNLSGLLQLWNIEMIIVNLEKYIIHHFRK